MIEQLIEKFEIDPQSNFILEIKKTSFRVPFKRSEIELCADYIRTYNAKGYDLKIMDQGCGADWVISFANEGIITLTSAALMTDFMFVKVDMGRGFFGGQKSKYVSTIFKLGGEFVERGPDFKRWLMALAGIGNVYRAVGFR
jgi:hypothetical protein